MNTITYKLSFNQEMFQYEIFKTENGVETLVFNSAFFCVTEEFVNGILANTYNDIISDEKNTVTITITK